MVAGSRYLCCVLAGVMGVGAATWGQNAAAQSSVTLYGSVDAGVLYMSNVGSSTGKNVGHVFAFAPEGDSPSRFGLRGIEDLGGGYQAIFVLESGINIANGGYDGSNGNFWGRLAYVGMRTPYGTVKAGMQYSPFLATVYDTDPRGFSDFGSGLMPYLGNVVLTGLSNPNSVSFTSPDIHGLQGSAMVALGGEAGNFKAGFEYSANLTYKIGGLDLQAAYYNGQGGGSGASIPVPSVIPFIGRTIGASYKYGDLTAKTSVAQYQVSGSMNNRVYSGGLSYALSPSVIVDWGLWYSRDANDSNNHTLLTSAGFDYFLSKQTNLYVQLAYMNNHGASNMPLTVPNDAAGVVGSVVGANIGITHRF